MRKMIVLLIMCGLIASSQAVLTITGGDFNTGTPGLQDIPYWWDFDGPDWWNSASCSAGPECFPTQSAFLGDAWPAVGGDRWMYQEIGTKASNTLYSVSFDFGQPTDGSTARTVGVQIDIYAGDFPTAAQNVDIADGGLTLVDTIRTPTTSEVGFDVYTHFEGELNLDAASLSDKLWIRLSNFGGETTLDAWLCVDNVEILSESAVRPYDPVVTPIDSEGAAGNIVKVGEDYEVHDVMLAWKAGPDPNAEFPVNPELLRSNIYLTTGAPDDPNLYLYATVPQVNFDDPNLSYGPLPDDLLAQATTYNWQIEQVMDNGSGGYPNGDPNNIWGNVWSFTTASAIPTILSGPVHTLTDTAGNATLEITTGLVATSARWYEVVGNQDSEANGETDDIPLTDSGIYSGTSTKILTITGAAADGSDDTRIYAIALNGTTPSTPSPVAWFWYPRLVSHYEFASISPVDGNSFTPDAISGYDAQLMSGDATPDLPSLDSNNAPAPGLASTNSMYFNNPGTNDDPNNADRQYLQVNEPWAGVFADITISAWVYTKSGGAAWNRIYDFGTASTASTFISTNAGGTQLRFAVNPTPGAEQSVSAPAGAYPNDEWVYVAATLSGNTAKLYINGEWVATNANMTADPVSNGAGTRNWIGRSQYGADPYFDGYIDDMKIFNYGLTNQEIADDYLAATEEAYVCDMENYDLENFDANENCLLDLPDFASMAARWLEDDRFYPTP